MTNIDEPTRTVSFADPLTCKRQTLEVSIVLINKASFYPVAITTIRDNTAFTLFIDANFAVRAIQASTIIDSNEKTDAEKLKYHETVFESQHMKKMARFDHALSQIEKKDREKRMTK